MVWSVVISYTFYFHVLVISATSSLSQSGRVHFAYQKQKSFSYLWFSKLIAFLIRFRTAEEIEVAQNTQMGDLRDPQEDGARVQRPEWLITIGVCTHLGCIPIAGRGKRFIQGSQILFFLRFTYMCLFLFYHPILRRFLWWIFLPVSRFTLRRFRSYTKRSRAGKSSNTSIPFHRW